MTTDAILHVGQNLRLGVDGHRPYAVLPSDGCCTVLQEIDVCATACSFIDLLPSGPMWDPHKAEVKQYLSTTGDITCDPVCPIDPPCPSMAMYAVYLAGIYSSFVSDILLHYVRESSPYTAVATIDDWLTRYAWQDCYRTNCRSIPAGQISPYEIEGECGLIYCPPSYSAEFENALKRATLQSIIRMRKGVIKNLDGINWVIAPLGAVLKPREWPEEVRDYLSADCDDSEDGPPCFCGEVSFYMIPAGATFPGTNLNAVQPYKSSGILMDVYPGVLVAECIVRAMLPKRCPNIIFQCKEF